MIPLIYTCKEYMAVHRQMLLWAAALRFKGGDDLEEEQ